MADGKTPDPDDPGEKDLEIELLLEAIYRKFDYDFRGYSRASLKRRIVQAALKAGCSTISDLQSKLLHDESYFAKLLSILTIPVTEMFRDPQYFRAVRTHVIPLLKTYPSIKIWVAGCSTGEEAYSFAIILKEEGILDRSLIYGTDINPESLAKARSGIFSMDQIQKFTENYQKSGGKNSFADYYRADYEAVILDHSLKKNIVFTDHSLATDAVFSEVQMVSCRNVLIYFDRNLQNRAIGLFRDSICRRGFLGIGSKENLKFSNYADDFEAFVPQEKIYRKH